MQRSNTDDGGNVSEANVELVKRFQQASMSGMKTNDDYQEVLDLLHPEVVVRVCRSLPHGGEWRGHDGFVGMSRAVVGSRRPLDTPNFTFLDCEPYVVVLIRFMSEALHTRTPVPIRMLEVFTFRDGKIASLEPYYEDTVPFWQASRGGLTAKQT
jgi:ketosteroid isomerase-like protein